MNGNQTNRRGGNGLVTGPASGLARRRTRTAIRPVRSSAGVETLEDRRLLATLGIAGGSLTYTADPGTASALTVSIDPANTSNVIFTDAGQAITLGAGTAGWSNIGAATVTGPSSTFSALLVDGQTTAGQRLQVDYTNGDPLPASGVRFNPTAAIAPAFNVLTLISGAGGTTFTTETSSGSAGTITYSDSAHSNVPITFTNLSSVADAVPSPTFVFNQPAGSTTVNFANDGTVGGVPADLIRDGGSGSFDHYSLANKATVTLNANNPGTLTTLSYPTAAAGLTALNVNTAGGGETVNVRNSFAGIPTHIDMGGGAGSTTHVGLAGLLTSIAGPVFVQSTGGANTLALDDPGTLTAHTYSIASSRVTGTSFPTFVDFSGGGITTLDLTSGGNGDTFNFTGPVQSDVKVYNFSADGGPGPNVLNVTSSVPNVNAAVQGTLTFGAGNPVVNYSNFGTVNLTEPAAAPSGTGVTLSSAVGQPLNNVIVATFTTTQPGTGPGDFAATVDWGDGTTTPGVIQPTGPNSYNILGSHVYSTTGLKTINVTLSALGGTSSISFDGTTVNVTTRGPVLSVPTPIISTDAITSTPIWAQGATVKGQEGQALNPAPGGDVLVASFIDTGAPGPVADYTASINWGDGSTTAATRITAQGTPNGTVFSVFGNHTYTERTVAPVNVTITRTSTGAAGIASGQAVITDAPLTAGAPVSLAATTGATQTNVVVGSFTDANTAAPLSDFTGTIDWGDGTVASPVTIVSAGAAGAFNVEGTHAFAKPGSYHLTIKIDDVDGATVSLTGSTIAVTDAPVTGAGKNFSAVEGNDTGTIVLATITDPNPLATVADVTATLGPNGWGDGTPAGTVTLAVTPIGGNATSTIFEVTGNHTYKEAGSFTVAISVTTKGGVTTALTPATATVADAKITATGSAITGVEGNSTGSVVIASFTDANPGATVAEFTAGNGSVKVNWGDGSAVETLPASAVTASGSPQGVVFTVTAAHTYKEAGHNQLSVTITDTDGATAVAAGSAVIADALLTAGAPVSLGAATGAVQTNVVVGSFTDANTGATPADFTGVIDWGDGTSPSAATIVSAGAAGAFNVEGTHAFAKPGTYALTIVVHDVDGSTVTLAGGTVAVSDNALTGAGKNFNAVEGNDTGTIVLATFTDPNPLATVADVTATLGPNGWGDGTPTGTVTLAVTPIGGTASSTIFEVTGSHTYKEAGSFTVAISVTTKGGVTTALTPATATVADARINATGAAITGVEGNSTGSVVIASFTDANPGATVADFTAGNGSVKVNWGDGSAVETLPASAVTASGSPQGVVFTVTAAHTYNEAGHNQVSVTITDTDGATAVAAGSAVIADAPLTASPAQPTVNATEHTRFSGMVGSFTDANPLAPLTDFTYVTINWGDGTPATAGMVSQPGGPNTPFIVSGTHTYADAGVNGGTGQYPITINVHDVDGMSVTINNTANVADVPLVVAGKLNPASDSGVSRTDNITNVVLPNFIGMTSEPHATVTLYAQPAGGGGAPVVLGQGVSNAARVWIITANHPLANGAYTITAVARDAAGETTSATTTIVANLVIDTVGPKVTSLAFNRLSGQIVVAYHDYGGANNAGAGLVRTTVIDASNYQFVTVHSPRVGKFRVNVVSDVPGTTMGTQTATLTINGGQYIPGGFYEFTARSASPLLRSGIQDVAGNALDGEFYGYFPSGNNVRGGDFVAQITAIHRVIYSPTTLVGNATPVSPPGTKQPNVILPVVVNPKKLPPSGIVPPRVLMRLRQAAFDQALNDLALSRRHH